MRTPPACVGTLFTFIACALASSSAVSAPEANDTTVTRVTVRGSEVQQEFDWAKLRAHGRIAYISSGPRGLRSRMIDNDLQTSFPFAESDQSPTVIVELAKSAQIHRVSTVFKAEDAQLDVMLLNELPKNLDDLQSAKPDISRVGLPDERGMITADFSVSSARFVVLRWKRKKRDEPFTVAEISAFSNDLADWTDDNARLASNSSSNFNFLPPTVPVVSP